MNPLNDFCSSPRAGTLRLLRFLLCFAGAFSGTIAAGFATATAKASPHDNWQKGNACYAQKKYDSAAIYFEQIAASKPADATVFYNLGNTYYRLNKIGLSVLNYERALKRKPDYKEAKENLLLAQSRIPGGPQQAPPDIFFIKWWKAITAPALIMVWSVISLIAFIVLIGLLLYRRLKRGEVYIRPQITGAVTLLWLTCLLLAFSSAYAALSNITGIIMKDGTVLTAVGKSPGAVKSLPEGTTVKIRSRKAGGYQVETTDGRNGLVASGALQIVD